MIIWAACLPCLIMLMLFLFLNVRAWLQPFIDTYVVASLRDLRANLFDPYRWAATLDIRRLTDDPLPPQGGIIASEWGMLKPAHRFRRGWTQWVAISGLRFTAFTYIGIPALIVTHRTLGFYVIAYTILGNVCMYLMMPHFWQMSHRDGQTFLTAADVVYDRFHSRALATCIALTGIIGTLTYLAMQIYAVDLFLHFVQIGTITDKGPGIAPEVPLVLLFLFASFVTYVRGIRFFRDNLALKVALFAGSSVVAFGVIWWQVRGGAQIWQLPRAGLLPLPPEQSLAFLSLSLGSAVAQWLYPHVQLGAMMADNAAVVRKSVVWTPLFSLILIAFTLLGLLTHAAICDPTKMPDDPVCLFGNNVTLPMLLVQHLAPVLVGVIFGAFIIDAVVTSVGMSVACGNLFAQNIYAYYFMHPTAPPTENEPSQRTAWRADELLTAARITSMIVKVGALALVLLSIQTKTLGTLANFQLLGGIWILQTLPALYIWRRSTLHTGAVLTGWLVGMVLSSALTLIALADSKSANQPIFGNIMIRLGPSWSFDIYAGLIGLLANIACAYGGSWLMAAMQQRAAR